MSNAKHKEYSIALHPVDDVFNLPIYTSDEPTFNEVAPGDESGRLRMRANIEKFEQFLVQVSNDFGDGNEMDRINEDGLVEHFIGGAYVRELFIPKDRFIVSRIWSKPRMWIIVSGEVTFTTEMGSQRVRGPLTKHVEPGSKVALYTHEDTLWFAITGAESVDSESVKEEVTVNDYSDFIYPWDNNSMLEVVK